jgi:hypothetical protein
MKIEIVVVSRYPVDLTENSVCRVEIRDVLMLDESSVTLYSFEKKVSGSAGGTILTAVFDISEEKTAQCDCNVWAHLSIFGDRRVRKEDFITTRSYPIRSDVVTDRMIIELQPVSRRS